jgi:hypothetical protein
MVAFAGSCLASTASAQADVYTHVEHVAVAFQGAPGGMGLLPTALSEAETAERHARLAAADSVSLAVWRLHAGHVLSALDPARVSGVRQGLGYGVRRAASEAANHMEILLSADSLPESMGIHAPRIFSALNSAVQRTDEATAVAQDILSAPSVTAARPLVGRLESLCEAILWGRDANEDGIAGWEQGEGGLAQAKYHMNLLRRAEGLGF